MYSHVFVRLKSRFGQKPSEGLANRKSVDADASAKLQGYISEVMNFSHCPNSFAWKLAHPVNSPAEMPAAVRDVLVTSAKVESFSPAIVTVPAGVAPPVAAPGAAAPVFPDPAVPLPAFTAAPTDETLPVPTFDEIMAGFERLVQSLPADSFTSFSLKLNPFRTGCMPARELAVALRDAIIARMEKDDKWYDRSFTAKRLTEELQQRLTAEAEARGASAAEIAAAKAAKLPSTPFYLDMTRAIGFWSPVSESGGSVAAAIANEPFSAKGRARSDAEKRVAAGKSDPRTRVADRVVAVKIGEVFLKKGNRSKFVMQLQNNIQHKLGGRGQVKRENHNFLVVPPAAAPEGYVFTDDDLEFIIEAVKCVAGVDTVSPVIRTGTDMASLVTAYQYLCAVAGANNEHPVTAAAPVASPSILYTPADARAAAAMLFAPASARYAAGVTPHELELRAAAADSLLSVTRLGARLDVHLHSSPLYTSKTTLARELAVAARKETSVLVGGSVFIPHPGRVYAEEQETAAAERAARREALLADYTAQRAKLLAAESGVSAESAAEEAAKDAAAAVAAQAAADAAAAAAAENASTWVAPRSGAHLRLDVTEHVAYLGFSSGPDYIDAIGGQPTATGGETQTVVALLSGGMDSPVAAFSMMRRGMRVILVHFQNANLADEDTVKHKIVQLAERLSRYQISTVLHIVPFSAIQDAIIMEVPSPARMLVYRRFMFHVAALVANKYNARFLVLGDALGQVASQTASNMFASYINTPLPILSPLVGSNKRDIMATAEKIGTYAISALPYGDCCSYFLAKHPLTKIKPEVLSSYEAAVGAKSPGGALQLVRSAFIASAILRWERADGSQEVLREVQPVQSVYHEQVAKLLESCPMRPRDADDDDEGGDDAADDEDGAAEGKGKGKGNNKKDKKGGDSAAAAVVEMSDDAVLAGASAAADDAGAVIDINSARDACSTEAGDAAGPRVKRARGLHGGEVEVPGQLRLGSALRHTGLSVYNPNFLASLNNGTNASAGGHNNSSASSASARAAGMTDGEDTTTPLTALADMASSTAVSTGAALPAPRAATTRAYFDNAATTPLLPRALAAMLPFLGGAAFANPSSQHSAGQGTAAIVDEARRVLLGLLNAPVAAASQVSHEAAAASAAAETGKVGLAGKKGKDQLLSFTSGGTEANNMAIIGAARAAVERAVSDVRDAGIAVAGARASAAGTATALAATAYTHLRVHLVTSGLEHNAVLEVVRALQTSPQLLAGGTNRPASNVTLDLNVKVSVDVTYVRNNTAGVVDVSHVEYILAQDNQRLASARAVSAAAGYLNSAPMSETGYPSVATPVLTLVTLMHGNNEVGTLQPLARIGAALAKHRAAGAAAVPTVFHTDACQSFGKVHLDVRECALDLVSINGHKLHGPKGVGALYVRPGVALSPLAVGGGHEGGVRPGTLNVPAIVGFAAAAADTFGVTTSLLDPALAPLPVTAPLVRAVAPLPTSHLVASRPGMPLPSLRGALVDIARFVKTVFPRAHINGPFATAVPFAASSPASAATAATDSDEAEAKTAASAAEAATAQEQEQEQGVQSALPNILSVTLDRSGWLDASTLIKFMSSRGVAVSSGSACASNAEPAPSHVLLGMDVRAEQANATVRLSLGRMTTPEEVEHLKKVLGEVSALKESRFKPLSR